MKKLDMQVTPKTVYSDIVSMPDPMLLGVTIHFHNHSDQTLYMKIFGSGPTGWSTNSVALGSLTSGNSGYINLDNFLSRTKPGAATTETITLILRGYTDAGYSVLFAEFSRTVTVIFIKSDDGSWTTDFSNDFDDGTVQGWAGANILGGSIVTLAVASDFVLSPPYSLKMTSHATWLADHSKNKIYKSFTTPNKTTIYVIFNLRFNVSSPTNYQWAKEIEILRDATVLCHLGKAYDYVYSHYVPLAKWLRLVIPLPASSTIALSVTLHSYCLPTGVYEQYIWLDDFKIISK